MIHPTAYIDPKAELGANVSVGPNSYVGPDVVLGDDCVLHNNMSVTGHTCVGARCEFFPGVVVGAPPQDLKYRGGRTTVEIGTDNVFREQVTVHAGTEVGSGRTAIGSHNCFLVGAHIAHDVVIGDHCILANYVQLAGHVHIEDRVTIGGLVGIHNFTTIGMLAYIGGLTPIVNDVPPFMIVEGNPPRIRGFNRTGLRRWRFSQEQILAIRDAYRALFSPKAEAAGVPLLERLAQLERQPDLNGEISHLCASVRRSLHDGVYGRYLESLRRDTDADREKFYKTIQTELTP
ncbi:MAG TPA: acyl-ACP--UDP-N-acetylglucosamine O-acyltransferase [Phycisphaerae bacterium]|nr:acyl-ACP--UDP-N-acetylglucosamine O-acyltransferase [Phycisphaerae bacterium]